MRLCAYVRRSDVPHLCFNPPHNARSFGFVVDYVISFIIFVCGCFVYVSSEVFCCAVAVLAVGPRVNDAEAVGRFASVSFACLHCNTRILCRD